MKTLDRRKFLEKAIRSTLTIGIGNAVLPALVSCTRKNSASDGEIGIFSIDPEVQFVTFSRKGEIMNDGAIVPDRHDGMACFVDENQNYVLVRNHEVRPQNFSSFPELSYDPTAHGGTTTLVIDKNLNLLEHYTSLSGTLANCSGGKTPWNTWLSCEETIVLPSSMAENAEDGISYLKKKHGYVFEVDPFVKELKKIEPLKEMGRFNHEAAAVHIDSGFVYMTEDTPDGCIYRYIPNINGKLSAGGTLQALKIKNQSRFDTRSLNDRIILECEWIDLTNIDSNKDDVRYDAQDLGAAIFIKAEGMSALGDDIYFTCSHGGSNKLGQIFIYHANSRNEGTLELIFQSKTPSFFKNPDQFTFNQWGDLILCEDGSGINRLLGVTPEGKSYSIVSSELSEWTGVCFSPDYRILFANLQAEGLTYAFQAPWEKLRSRAT